MGNKRKKECYLTVKLDRDIFQNNLEYFFTFLADRFEVATFLWKEALGQRFQKQFEPIFILPATGNEFFSRGNYILINKRANRIYHNARRNDIVFLPENEDITEEFSVSPKIKHVIEKLEKKQGRVFVLPFTSANLFLSSKRAIILGPDPRIATQYDNKVEHAKLFQKLNVPRNSVRILSSLKDAKKELEKFPIFLSASFSSGGHESKVIRDPAQIDAFAHTLRRVNRGSKFLAARFIEDVVLSPNSNAFVAGKDRTIVNCIADQLLRGHQYLGNVYPSKTTKSQKETIKRVTVQIGDYLSRKGFRGMFGLDFIIDRKGAIYVTDLNPRRQGGYLCHLLSAHSKNINLVDLELRVFLGEPIPKIFYEDFQIDYAWGHSKVKPYQSGQRIVKTFSRGDPFQPFERHGETYAAIFYPKQTIFAGGSAGYYITTGDSYDEVKTKLHNEVEEIVSENFAPTQWEAYFNNPRTHNLLQ